MKNKNLQKFPDDLIESKIFLIRKKKVMFDKDLASLYGVETKVLNQAVKRNLERFPDDFMFQLSGTETDIFSRSQIVTLKRGKNIKYLPYVFTEQGVAMLSSVLKSKQAIAVNIQIMRTFTKIREMIVNNEELKRKIEILEKKYDNEFNLVFDAIRKILDTQIDTKANNKKIGFKIRK